MARIVGRLSVAGLEARHAQAIRLPAKGRTVAEGAGVPALTPRWVEVLAARYDARGPEVPGDGRRAC